MGAFQGAVLANADRLQRLQEADWLRSARYDGGESYSVEDWLLKMSSHAGDHASLLLKAVARGVT